MFTTYVLYSNTLLKYYTGHCEDLGLRLVQHNSGKNKSTKNGIPWIVIFSKEADTRGDAIKLEIKIKKRGAKRFLDDQNKLSSAVG